MSVSDPVENNTDLLTDSDQSEISSLQTTQVSPGISNHGDDENSTSPSPTLQAQSFGRQMLVPVLMPDEDGDSVSSVTDGEPVKSEKGKDIESSCK